jgi:hypothetical protein
MYSFYEMKKCSCAIEYNESSNFVRKHKNILFEEFLNLAEHISVKMKPAYGKNFFNGRLNFNVVNRSFF